MKKVTPIFVGSVCNIDSLEGERCVASAFELDKLVEHMSGMAKGQLVKTVSAFGAHAVYKDTGTDNVIFVIREVSFVGAITDPSIPFAG